MEDKRNGPSDGQVYASASAIGIVAGMRAVTAPAVVGQIARSGCLGVERSKFGVLGNAVVSTTVALLAVGEAIADKTPNAPDRTATVGLAARIFSGAFCGATLCRAQDRSAVVGAIAGAFGAIGSTFAAFHLRREIGKGLGIPDIVVALIEDATAVWGGLAIADGLRHEPQEDQGAA